MVAEEAANMNQAVEDPKVNNCSNGTNNGKAQETRLFLGIR